MVSDKQVRAAVVRAPGSTVHMRFRTPPPPPVFLPLSGGGGPELGAHLFNGPDQSARINGDKGNSGPPCLSTFKRRGGVWN
jgi:hypothetical protein